MTSRAPSFFAKRPVSIGAEKRVSEIARLGEEAGECDACVFTDQHVEDRGGEAAEDGERHRHAVEHVEDYERDVVTGEASCGFEEKAGFADFSRAYQRQPFRGARAHVIHQTFEPSELLFAIEELVFRDREAGAEHDLRHVSDVTCC